jgi:hypothetical protein
VIVRSVPAGAVITFAELAAQLTLREGEQIHHGEGLALLIFNQAAEVES